MTAMRFQHAAVADHAGWLFQGFPDDRGTRGEVIPHSTVDFAALRTVEEAEAA